MSYIFPTHQEDFDLASPAYDEDGSGSWYSNLAPSFSQKTFLKSDPWWVISKSVNSLMLFCWRLAEFRPEALRSRGCGDSIYRISASSRLGRRITLYISTDSSHPFTFAVCQHEDVWKEVTSPSSAWGSVGQTAEAGSIWRSCCLCLQNHTVALGPHMEFEKPCVVNPWKQNPSWILEIPAKFDSSPHMAFIYSRFLLRYKNR